MGRMVLKRIIKSVGFALFVAFATTLLSPVSGVGIVSVAQAAVAERIDVRGNERIDDDVVISYLTISPGDRYNSFDIDNSVKALFSTGLFSDVSIFGEGRTLVVEVDENSTVNKVFFEGNSRLKDDALAGVVRLKAQSVYSDEQAASDVERIELAYARVGRRDAGVSYEAVPLPNNRINVIYRVDEGDKTKISRINFVGNDTFGSQRLADVISTKRSTIFSFLTTNDIYDQNRINADEEALRNFYFNKGFADFQVISTDAYLDPDANEYEITFTLEEGPRYTFGNITIDSTINGVDSNALYELLETQSGEHYSARAVEESILNVTERVAQEGFAFVEVVPRGSRNFEDNTIDVTYLVDEGARLYIEDIVIIGNDRTRDYVIRREFDISEGDAFNQVLINKARDRIERLGFFEDVQINTRPGSSPDKVIVVARVREQGTGDISISGGFSTNGGASAQIALTEKNFLGRGQFLRVAAQGGEDESSYSFQFREPYFLGYRVAAGLSLQSIESDATSDRNYQVDSIGGTVTFAAPITEDLTGSVLYSFLSSDTAASARLIDTGAGTGANGNGVQGDVRNELSSAIAIGLGDFVASGFGYGLVYNTLDDPKLPREGVRASINQTFFGAGGDAEFINSQAALAAYYEASEEQDIILFGRVRGGHITTLGTDNGTTGGAIRITDNFQARGNQMIRGFDSFGFGPRDPLTGDPLGGRTYWNATAEVTFPLPFIPRTLGLRGALFADVGQLFDPGNFAQTNINASSVAAGLGGLTAAQINQVNSDSVRASVGASVVWNSPFGPLRLDYAIPIASENFDDIEEFNFGVSSAF